MSLPSPVTREEIYLNAIANGDSSNLPTPETREEVYLDYIAKNGGGGGVAGVSSFKGRTGAVTPQNGDYTAEMVGAASTEALAGKADKVTSPTADNLASLDASGNLADSGISKDMLSTNTITTPASNPITFTTKSAQIAEGFELLATATQDLHGYDYPWVGGTNVNLYDCTISESTTFDVIFSNVSDADGNKLGVKAKGLASNYAMYNVNCPLKAGTYKTFESKTSNNFSFNVRDANGSWLADPGNEFTLSEDTTIKIRYYVNSGVSVDDIIYCMVYKYSGTDATAFSPYSNICPIVGFSEKNVEVSDGDDVEVDYTISFGDTVYGVKVTEQGCVVPDASIDLVNGVETTWSTLTSGGKRYFYNSIANGKKTGTSGGLSGVKCSCFKPTTADWQNMNDGEISIGSTFTDANKCSVAVRFEQNITTQEFATLIAGQQVVYELATPIPLPISPIALALLAGTNVITTDGDSIKITYRDGIVATLEDIVAEDERTDAKLAEGLGTKAEISAIADNEPNATSSQAYAVGGHFYKDGKFCTAIAQIASGATFTKGTNYVEGTIADNMIKQSTFSGTTSARGNLKISNDTNIAVLGISSVDNIFIPFRYFVDGSSDNGWYVHVIDDSNVTKANASVSGTYYYI